ncbi:MAG: glycosyltransferase family 4 protein [Candidatus Sabulitectum sp.]|nr:glycosyltransferase family 4 protein [Candidatus Sabulitectum sp.]
MRILYVLGFLPPYITREIEAMATREHSISVLLPEDRKNSETADFWNGISQYPETNSVGIRRNLKFKYLTCPLKQLAAPAFRSVRFIKTLTRSLKEREFRYFVIASDAVTGMDHPSKPDVIHAHFAQDQAHIARIMASILKVPYTVTTHATDIFVPKCKTRLRRVLCGASRVFTISEYNLSRLAEYGLNRENIVVSRLGLDTTELPYRKKPSSPPVAVCTASGLVPKKGVHVLIQAMRLLQQRRINCRLTVIGSDPDGTKLEEYRKNTTDLPVDFVGVLNSKETLDAVSAASFFVLPCIEAENGDKDGIPVALIEAMGMGVPCISTRISGIPELIENDISGILVKPESPEELAVAMTTLLSGIELADRLGSAGRNKVIANHSPDNQADILTANLTQIVAENTVRKTEK